MPDPQSTSNIKNIGLWICPRQSLGNQTTLCTFHSCNAIVWMWLNFFLDSPLGSITFCLTQSHQLPSPSYHGSSLIGHQPLVVVTGESLSGKNRIGFWFNFILLQLPDTAFELNLIIVSPSINSSHVGFWELSFLPVRLTNTMLQLKKISDSSIIFK